MSFISPSHLGWSRALLPFLTRHYKRRWLSSTIAVWCSICAKLFDRFFFSFTSSGHAHQDRVKWQSQKYILSVLAPSIFQCTRCTLIGHSATNSPNPVRSHRCRHLHRSCKKIPGGQLYFVSVVKQECSGRTCRFSYLRISQGIVRSTFMSLFMFLFSVQWQSQDIISMSSFFFLHARAARW